MAITTAKSLAASLLLLAVSTNVAVAEEVKILRKVLSAPDFVAGAYAMKTAIDELQKKALVSAAQAPMDSGCLQFVQDFDRHAPVSVYMARLSEGIYKRSKDSWFRAKQVDVLRYFDEKGGLIEAYNNMKDGGSSSWYAEVHNIADASKPIVIAFRGTDIINAGDIKTNIAQAIGIHGTPHYTYGSLITKMTMAKHRDRQVILTGHSLGGGVAMYAALVMNVPAYVFNPAGLSGSNVAEIRSHEPGFDINDPGNFSNLRVYVSRDNNHADPVSAFSMAANDVISTRIFGTVTMVRVGTNKWDLALHSIKLLRKGLETAVDARNRGQLTDEDVCAAYGGYWALSPRG